MTTVVTAATGGRATPATAVYVPPDRQVLGGEWDGALAEASVDPAFLADLLSACLAHERCGAHLYRSVSGRTGQEQLRAQYEHFGEETLEHVAKLEALIAACGSDPNYVSAAARATEKAAAGLLESTFMLDGSLDPVTAELAMLEAVMLAEAKDQANWVLLSELAESMPSGDIRSMFAETTSEVLAQEEEHYTWAAATRAAMLRSLVIGTSTAAEPTKEDLYHEAQELGIEGRSRMTKDELVAAVADAKGGGR